METTYNSFLTPKKITKLYLDQTNSNCRIVGVNGVTAIQENIDSEGLRYFYDVEYSGKIERFFHVYSVEYKIN